MVVRKKRVKKVTPKKRKGKKKKSGSRVKSIKKLSLYAGGIVFVVLFFSLFYLLGIRPYRYMWRKVDEEQIYGVVLPENYEIHGVDISRYQGKIDWKRLLENKYSKHPIHFVFMKATEGGDHIDTTFHSNFFEAKRAGFIRGAYHFFSPTTCINKQADFYKQTVQLLPGDLPPVLDVEVKGSLSKKELKERVYYWLTDIEKEYGVKPIIYTSYKFKNKFLSDSIFNQFPYWIAHYYVDSVRYQGKWTFWQHSDIGKVPGIEKEVDLNVFNGSLLELEQLTIP